MKCPRCVQRIHRAAVSCPQCGFTLADADERFGDENLKIRCLTDSAGVLRRGERERVQAAMAKINKRFPQLFIGIYTGALGEMSHFRQFGFWLLNRAIFEDVPGNQPNAAAILITMDPESKVAGIVFGYLLDPYLEEADTFECLARAHAYWLEQRYAEGLLRVLTHLDRILAKRSQQAQRDPAKFERKVTPPAQMGALLQRIRAGNPTQTEPSIPQEIRP